MGTIKKFSKFAISPVSNEIKGEKGEIGILSALIYFHQPTVLSAFVFSYYLTNTY